MPQLITTLDENSKNIEIFLFCIIENCTHASFILYLYNKGCNKFFEKKHNFLELDQKFFIEDFQSFKQKQTTNNDKFLFV